MRKPRPLYRIVVVDGRRVREHRLVAEKILGRPLTRGEHVHHMNEDPKDNRPENLAVMTASQHVRLHWYLRAPYRIKGFVPEGGWTMDYHGLPTSAEAPQVLEMVGARLLSSYIAEDVAA